MRYERSPEDGSLTETSRARCAAQTEGDVSYMNDGRGVHAIINPSQDEVAVSLHIYAPPFRKCLIFQPTTGEPKEVCVGQGLVSVQLSLHSNY